jgi:hypothetical protein
VGLGISVDEWQRVNNKNRPLERLEFPLIDANLSRADCLRIVSEAGLPPPAKSACYFCPLRKPAHWSEMRRDRPDLFERAAALEDRINEGRPGRPAVFLARGGAPLRSIGAAQDSLFDQAGFGGEQSSLGEEGCDEGRCWV